MRARERRHYDGWAGDRERGRRRLRHGDRRAARWRRCRRPSSMHAAPRPPPRDPRDPRVRVSPAPSRPQATLVAVARSTPVVHRSPRARVAALQRQGRTLPVDRCPDAGPPLRGGLSADVADARRAGAPARARARRRRTGAVARVPRHSASSTRGASVASRCSLGRARRRRLRAASVQSGRIWSRVLRLSRFLTPASYARARPTRGVVATAASDSAARRPAATTRSRRTAMLATRDARATRAVALGSPRGSTHLGHVRRRCSASGSPRTRRPALVAQIVEQLPAARSRWPKPRMTRALLAAARRADHPRRSPRRPRARAPARAAPDRSPAGARCDGRAAHRPRVHRRRRRAGRALLATTRPAASIGNYRVLAATVVAALRRRCRGTALARTRGCARRLDLGGRRGPARRLRLPPSW